ncbi:hypothetical protein CDIK_2397 [Cucumispora dikerogammari]|nr:hypothetical protein CDIK_2397 [Cucumispora dikerogammari]
MVSSPLFTPILVSSPFFTPKGVKKGLHSNFFLVNIKYRTFGSSPLFTSIFIKFLFYPYLASAPKLILIWHQVPFLSLFGIKSLFYPYFGIKFLFYPYYGIKSLFYFYFGIKSPFYPHRGKKGT